jgi:hypothetical protein
LCLCFCVFLPLCALFWFSDACRIRLESAGPSIEGPPGCEGLLYSCILYPLHPCILHHPCMPACLFAVFCMLYPACLFAGFCILYPVSCILDVGIGPGIQLVSVHYPYNQDPGGIPKTHPNQTPFSIYPSGAPRASSGTSLSILSKFWTPMTP